MRDTKRLLEKLLERLDKEEESNGLETAVTEIAQELRKEKHGPVARFVLAFGKDILVPIGAATIGALGVYYVEIAKLTDERVREAAAEEIDRADAARDFVERHLQPTIDDYRARTASAEDPTDVEPPDLDSPEVRMRLLEMWESEHAPVGLAPAVGDVPNTAQWSPPEQYINRAIKRAAEKVKK